VLTWNHGSCYKTVENYFVIEPRAANKKIRNHGLTHSHEVNTGC